MAQDRDDTTGARRWLVVATVAVPLAVVSIDFGGASVALPSIGEDLGVSAASLGWVINAFALGSAAPLVAAGRVADALGRRKVLLAGLALFTVATVVCGIAPNFAVLILGRTLQGVATALFMTASLGIISSAFDEPFRTRAIGVWSAAGGVALAAGPLAGGLLTGLASWRWFFLVNVPVLVVGMILTVAVIEESRADRRVTVAPWSAALVTIAAAAGVFAVQEAGALGWSDPWVLGLAVVALATGGAFAVLERRSDDPLIARALWHTRPFWGATSVAFLANWGFGATNYLITLYLQDIVGWSAIDTGLAFLAYSVPFAALGFTIGAVVRRFGVRGPMAFGMVAIAASFVCFALVSDATGSSVVVLGLAIAGFGQGLAYNLSTTSAMGAVGDQVAGVAGGVLTTVRNLGVVLGVTVSTVVLRDVSGGLSDEVEVGQAAPAELADAFVSGIRWVAVVIVAVSLLGPIVVRRAVSPATRGSEPPSEVSTSGS